MARDKAKDDKYFNCSQQHEHDYVANLYPNPGKVKEFLKRKCQSGKISNSTHLEVYRLIQSELGFAIPV